jgi:hypothetical protein
MGTPPEPVTNYLYNEVIGTNTQVDLTQAKKLPGSIYPEGAFSAPSGFGRIEPFLTPESLKTRFLFGLPLVSPITRAKITDVDLIDYIKRGASQLEVDAKVVVTPVMQRVRLPFDPALYEKNIWLECPYKPMQKLAALYIASASYANTPDQNAPYPAGANIYQVPNDWVDVSYAVKGKIFVNPINPAFAAVGTAQQAAFSGAGILQFIGMNGYVPAFWSIDALFGFCTQDGQVPLVVNEALGAWAAILLLTNLFPLFRATSHSLSADGLGQSSTDALQQLLQAKIEQLKLQYANNVKQIRSLCGTNFTTSNV